MLITLRVYLSPVCDSLFHGLWTSGGASRGKVFSLSFPLALIWMLQCPLCSKSLSVGFSLVTHLSIEFHWWSFVYLAILIMFCQTSSFFFSERLRKQQTKFLGTPLLLEDQLWIFLLFIYCDINGQTRDSAKAQKYLCKRKKWLRKK